MKPAAHDGAREARSRRTGSTGAPAGISTIRYGAAARAPSSVSTLGRSVFARSASARSRPRSAGGASRTESPTSMRRSGGDGSPAARIAGAQDAAAAVTSAASRRRARRSPPRVRLVIHLGYPSWPWPAGDDLRTRLSILVLAGLALAPPASGRAAPAPSASKTLVVCAPGYPGDTATAQPTMDAFAKLAAEAAGWG